MSHITPEERQNALSQLRRELKPGAKVYTILRHVSRSGMRRSISLVRVDSRGNVHQLDWLVSRAGLGKVDQRNGGLIAGDTGMDMGFALVYGLARALYPKGHRCTGDARTCPSNDHSNDYGEHARAWDRRYPLMRQLAMAAEHDALARRIVNHVLAMRNADFHAQVPELVSRKRRHADGGYALRQVWL